MIAVHFTEDFARGPARADATLLSSTDDRQPSPADPRRRPERRASTRRSGPERRARGLARAIAIPVLVGLASAVAFWAMDALLDAFWIGVPYGSSLLRPAHGEAMVRASVAMLAAGYTWALVHVRRSERRARVLREAVEQKARALEEANAVKELFLDIMSHDLLNPAGTIRNSAAALLAAESAPAKKRLLSLVVRGATRIVELCDNASTYGRLRSLGRIESVELELGALLRAVVKDHELHLRERGTSVDLPSPGERWARAHAMISDVFANLLSNAVKYGPERGTIEISIRDGDTDWVVAVKDRGQGIPDEYKARIFDRFERAGKEGVKGSGLGLTIARLLVERAGGAIWVEDNPGGGSAFHVRLPKADRAPG